MSDKPKDTKKEISQKELVIEMILGMLGKWKEMLIVTLKHKEESAQTLGAIYDMIYDSAFNKGNDEGYAEGFEDGYVDCENDVKEITGLVSLEDLNQFKKLQEIGKRIGIEVTKLPPPLPTDPITKDIDFTKDNNGDLHRPVLEKLLEITKPNQN